MRPYERENRGTGDEPGGKTCGIKAHDSAAPLGRGNGIDPIFAEHEKRGQGGAENRPEREPSPIIIGQGEGRKAECANKERQEKHALDAEPSRRNRHERRAEQSGKTTRCRVQAYGMGRIALFAKAHREQSHGERQANSHDRNRRYGAGERGEDDTTGLRAGPCAFRFPGKAKAFEIFALQHVPAAESPLATEGFQSSSRIQRLFLSKKKGTGRSWHMPASILLSSSSSRTPVILGKSRVFASASGIQTSSTSSVSA